MTIAIGKVDGKAFTLRQDVVTSTLVVYGGKGMGKTNFGSVLVEELTKAGLRWSVIDPMGVWWGLRHSKDGKGPGVECLILGGAHGDIPIEPTGGAVVADLVADENVNVIVDCSRKPSGESWGVAEKIRFVTEYGRRLFQRQGSLVGGQRREPILQVLDEAARYIPQMVRAGEMDVAKCVSVWAQIVEEGRNAGMGVCLLTQRSARLNKDVAELADAMMAFRTIGPNSIAAVMDWLGEHVPRERIKANVETLRSLPRGACLFVSPGWMQFEGIVAVRERETFDSSATPRPGERARKVTGQGATPDLSKYAERMRETIEAVKQNDPRELKRRVAELEAELRKAQASPAACDRSEQEMNSAIIAAVQGAVAKRDEAWIATIGEKVRSALTGLSAIAHSVQDNVSAVSDTLDGLATHRFDKPVPLHIIAANSERKGGRGESPEPLPRAAQLQALMDEAGVHGVVARAVFTRTERKPLEAKAENNGDLTNPQKNILAALAQFASIGREAVPKKWVAALAGASHSSSSFGNNLGALRSGGYIDYPAPATIALTPKGHEHAPFVAPPKTANDMLARCEEILTGPQRRILRELARVWPKAIDKRTLAHLAEASSTSSSYGNNLGALRSAGMIDYPAGGLVRLSPWVVLE